MTLPVVTPSQLVRWPSNAQGLHSCRHPERGGETSAPDLKLKILKGTHRGVCDPARITTFFYPVTDLVVAQGQGIMGWEFDRENSLEIANAKLGSYYEKPYPRWQHTLTVTWRTA